MLMRRYNLSIQTHAIIIFALLAILFAIVSTVTLDKVNKARSQVIAERTQAAKLEIAQALLVVQQEMRESSQQFLNWDETHQQLFDSTYYPYWRDIRVKQREILPKTVNAVELYDARGQSLISAVSTAMPRQVSGQQRMSVWKQNSRINGYLLLPIYDGYSKSQRSGYALIRFDFLDELQDAIPYHYVDPKHLVITLGEDEQMDVDILAPHISYQLQSADLDLLFEVMVKAQYQIAMVLVVLSSLLYFVLMRFIARPLQRLSKHIDTLKQHYEQIGLPVLEQHLAVKELENVRISLNDYQLQLNDMHSRIDEKNVELWGLAHHDALTGAFNRRSFEEDWAALSTTITELEGELAFLLFDCDYFKSINDTYGHHVGDNVLMVVANIMQSCLRGCDKLYRIGGDEFAVVFIDLDSGRCVEVAKRCIAAVRQHDFTLLGIKDPVRISVGIATTNELTTERMEVLPKQADMAMYYAKQPGHQKLAIYSDAMGDLSKSVFSNQVTNAVFNAINTGHGIVMHYQPVVNLVDQTIEYHEALVRLSLDDSLISPHAIFPIVAARHIEAEFDFAIMRSICEDLKNQIIPSGTGVSINLSGMSIVHDALFDHMAAFCPFLNTHKLVLEVTETVLITQLKQASSCLLKLREMGFIIALDDFGSGYSSLSYLANMPVDIVKFDMSMIHSLELDGRHQGIIEGLATMIKHAGYALVAEGLENEPLLNKVRQIGFSHGQGYLLGVPTRTPMMNQSLNFNFENTETRRLSQSSLF